MDTAYHREKKASDDQSVIPPRCGHCGWRVALYFDPTEQQLICYPCLLKIRKGRIQAIAERRRERL